MDILLTLTVGTLCIVCFLIGAKVGQQVSKGETIKTPTLNPMQLIREHQERKQAEYEKSKRDIILQNIESYDGTPNRQEDVPR
jgi:hypothetical protein